VFSEIDEKGKPMKTRVKVGVYRQFDYFGHEDVLVPGSASKFTVKSAYTMTKQDKKQKLRATDIREKCSVDCLQFR
jgi:hypothetical protein